VLVLVLVLVRRGYHGAAMRIINPASLVKPLGFNHGVLAEGGLLFVAGQVGWNGQAQFETDRFVDQFDQALANVMTVVTEAGGTAESVARMTIYVVDRREYFRVQREVGEKYRARMGRHFPAMTLVEVSGLLEPRAKVEIEATAVI
jgi:enamine deaminase RidA (YjgF/YER057c/UK114 family)